MLQTVTIETRSVEADHLGPLHPVGATAALIHRKVAASKGKPLLYIAQTARRAQDILAILQAFAPTRDAAFLPPWDSLPGDGVGPSAQTMGRRMSVLRWLTDKAERPPVVITTAEALLRRVPPRAVWKNRHVELRVGETIDPDAVGERLAEIGYVVDDRVDEPGEAAVRGRVVDIFPAAAPRPCRIEHENGRITAIRSYDPVSQRSVATTEHLIVDPASERIGAAVTEATAAREPDLPRHYGQLETLFDYLPDAVVLMEDGVDRRADSFFEQIREGHEDGVAARIDKTFLKRSEFSRAIGGRLDAIVEDGTFADGSATVPRFVADDDPMESLAGFAADIIASGDRLVFAAPTDAILTAWLRPVERALDRTAHRIAEWDEATAAEPGAFLALIAPLAEGFRDRTDDLTLVTARDIAGHRAGSSIEGSSSVLPSGSTRFEFGDAVVHLDHGVGVLEGLDEIADGNEALRLRYADDATLLVPMSDIAALWRYGSADGVHLDKLKGDRWRERRDEIMSGVRATAEGLVVLAAEKAKRRCAPIQPDARLFERFCARFSYELTRDQEAATDAVLADLASGRPMDRLVCGDVGFGKTEVALRAAAAAVFSGRQVAVVAPTTVLAQQHFRLFAKRFARLGIEVAQLSRLGGAAEAKAVKAGLADGRIQIVVGTHAVAAKDVAFHDLALVVIDEEQRFGSAHKTALRRLGREAHVLAMTATPIPRTLQAGFVGLHDLSVIATPPVLRQPVATRVEPFCDDAVRDALQREKKRGGRSFVVCPRIEDLQPMAERLARIVPDLEVTLLHGKMAAEDLDETMLAFAGGQGDVLLATNIIESGLDVPGANTMIVWRPDRFGIGQLHQLRGRVGRGARRGIAILATDPDRPLGAETEKRLRTLEALNRLGAGFEISARDLDLRGAGELLGDEQAGHLQLIGLQLYRHVLEHAMAAASGKATVDDRVADLRLGVEGRIPKDYIPEPEMRINLAARIAGARDAAALDLLLGEVEDRFGPLPDPLRLAFDLARLRGACRDLGIHRLDAGPKAIAASFDLARAEALAAGTDLSSHPSMSWSKNRLIDTGIADSGAEPVAAAMAMIETAERLVRGKPAKAKTGAKPGARRSRKTAATAA
ncbi:DEAD/DEAH box helicase [Aureimonas sp. Leaf454]|uniref:DEAD/DEAH box helicase n=1 Tax=Aureimonas sp. Leaf454 TaxID=1736381 RepID=UPI0006F3B698|nr:DEAD/DEAH box helicase [Aureimonas sp. Leaf454]KQT50973.1 DEAD/DEAH box helicase [Aureimonas sp. Leaf454]